MAYNDDLIAELKQESASTKRILERVPFDHPDWKPHDKSFSIGRLATHVAEIPHWITRIITIDDWDFATRGFSVTVAGSHEELLRIFETKLSEALEHLGAVT